MSRLAVAISAVNVLMVSAVLGGLIARKRLPACWTFSAYLLSVAADRVAVLAWPQTFWTWTSVAVTDAAQTALVALIAAEIAYKTFRTLPAGYRRLRRVMGVLALGTVIVVVVGSTWPRHAAEWTLVSARVSYGLAFLFAAFVLFARYHRFPLDPLHREIALGFVLRSLLVAFAHALSQYDDLVGLGHYSISKVAYPLILLGWVWSAWRPEPPTALSPEVLRRLRPWRVR
jgi:hypothetical protein